MDSTTGRAQSLLLTDNYKVGFPHWQIASSGTLRMGLRLPSYKEKPDHTNVVGYGSPVIFSPRQNGIWTFLCTTLSLEEKTAVHYLNGVSVSTDVFYVEDIPILGPAPNKKVSHKVTGRFPDSLQIGTAEIGNWGAPFRPENAKFAIRNFVGRIDSLTIWQKALAAGTQT